MINKKVISIVVAGAIGCSMISGCQNNDAPSESEIIVETMPETIETTTDISLESPEYTINNSQDATNVISQYAQANNIDMGCYPQELIDMFVVYPDAYDFVTQYPMYELEQVELDYPAYMYPDISGEISKVVIPRLYQWDTRWGYRDYCGRMFGFNGSGPTCVSIAAIYFLGNTDFTPAWIMDYCINNSYCDVDGGGTYRTLITSGAAGLGIDVVEITVDEDRVKRNLDVGNVVVCAMGNGIFSNPYESEHYIIITGYEGESFTIIDPASRTRTEQQWTWTGLAASMNVPWVYRIM